MAELSAGDFLDDALSVTYGKIWQNMANYASNTVPKEMLNPCLVGLGRRCLATKPPNVFMMRNSTLQTIQV
jgi:hypothetical protein